MRICTLAHKPISPYSKRLILTFVYVLDLLALEHTHTLSPQNIWTGSVLSLAFENALQNRRKLFTSVSQLNWWFGLTHRPQCVCGLLTESSACVFQLLKLHNLIEIKINATYWMFTCLWSQCSQVNWQHKRPQKPQHFTISTMMISGYLYILLEMRVSLFVVFNFANELNCFGILSVGMISSSAAQSCWQSHNES